MYLLHRPDGSIEPREVEFGPQVEDDVVVSKGLKEGEEVVTSANFLIDSEAQLQAAPVRLFLRLQARAKQLR